MVTEGVKVKWDGEETIEVFRVLKSFGYKNDFDASERYETFSKIINEDGDKLTVVFDFDPYMHIDETDDDICYDYPVYVYIESDSFYSESYGYFYYYVQCIEDLKNIIDYLETA